MCSHTCCVCPLFVLQLNSATTRSYAAEKIRILTIWQRETSNFALSRQGHLQRANWFSRHQTHSKTALKEKRTMQDKTFAEIRCSLLGKTRTWKVIQCNIIVSSRATCQWHAYQRKLSTSPTHTSNGQVFGRDEKSRVRKHHLIEIYASSFMKLL